ncbi:glycosyl transferase, family 2 [hydrocarbon metagenome]|uniref:Glycosyl transferase, family 2 n=1 Tax=hydrocarbon metagenome TaxID=938273 RepID=A0A0W8FGY9_9ZZZZ
MRSFEKGKVSIITPCYNGEPYLDRYFDSICRQTYDRVELIIVNDEQSTDNSEEICLSWKPRVEERGYEFRYILQKTYRGVAGAINEGLPYVTGEFLIWPDSDDTLMPTSIEKRVDFLNSHPDYAMVRSDYVSVYDESPDVVVRYGSDLADVTDEDIFENLIFEKTYVTPGCYMVRSSVLFERIPGGEIYWENQGGQNWQLLIPCAYRNKAGYINEPLYKYHIRPGSHSRRVDGDEYAGRKNRAYIHHEILYHVINGLHLLTDDEKADYLKRIDLKYIAKRLELALLYNKPDDAETEMQALERMRIDPGTSRKVLCLLCRAGVSGYVLAGYASLDRLSRRVRKARQRGRIRIIL